VNCPNCGTENLAGSKFCRECASPLAAGCPNCGFVNLPNSKFCAECATPLTAAAPRPAAAPRSEPEVAAAAAQRRLVSVLFADLVGFTPFAEERDSEEVRETLSKYFDMAREVIERYGGTVEKFIGDAVMAVWGAPTAREDDAELAVRAALELVDTVPELGPGIQARAGVLTGEAAVTIGATNQGMVAGDIVNTASRLQSVAQPGTVLVGESTHRATTAAIAYEAAGEKELKGKSAPVAAWRALRIVAERGGRNRAEALEAPFVGRQEEMRLLKDLFQATGREKRLRVISVIGPAGIGKSRLAWEFLKYIDGLVETVYWHSGRSPAYGEGIAFWALGEMVRERCGLAEMDDEQTTRTKVDETVAEWVADPAEREWIARALLTLLGVEGGMASDQLFSAWRTFFERIAANGPVALVFEDMHFADPGLLDFIDHLLEWSRGLPIYVVTLARPDLLERRQSWGAGKRNFFSMSLEPLSESDMRELLAGLVPGLPAKAVATIVTRADGIPLYAVETVRTLVTDGKLVEENGVYVPQGDLTTLAVPETLTALIAARLDRLDETDRRIVYDAAVLGQSFTEDALAALAEVPVADLDVRLTGLVRRELLHHELDPRSPERGQYGFVQALIREVAYNTLARKDRKKLHIAAARYFEALGSDEIAGALASHYLAAFANAGEDAEADALQGQARIALKAAASRAAALGGYDQAVAFYEQAVSVTGEPADQADLLERASAAARIAGHWQHAEELIRRAIDLYREAVEVARRSGHRDNVLRISGNLGYTGFLAGQWDMGMDAMEAVWSDDLAPFEGILLLNNMLDIRASWGESVDEGAAQMEQLGLSMTDPSWRVFLNDTKANEALAGGDLDRARDLYADSVALDVSLGSEAHYRATRPALWAHDLDETRRLAALAEAAGGYGPLIAARRVTMHAGIAALEGKPAEALALYREALKGWRATNAVWDEALTGIDMATLLDPSEPEVAAVIDSTREILERLRAKPYLERLDAAAARLSAAAPSRQAAAVSKPGVARAD
jgi:class 3 adenylate cyclase/tetratricopeptide (TPR) repeat protein